MHDIVIGLFINKYEFGLDIQQYSTDFVYDYHKRNKGKSKNKEPWYILTSLNNVEEVIKIYKQRMGIEIMFKDYKSRRLIPTNTPKPNKLTVKLRRI